MAELLKAWRDVHCVVIGMLHLPPLSGSPRYRGDLQGVKQAVLRDAQSLVGSGADGLLLENFGDAPFYPRRVPTHTATTMTSIASDIRQQFPDVPLGINVLRNDGLSALAIAHAIDAHFIRVNVLCGARLTDQGLIEGIAHRLLRLRQQLAANHIKICADVDVKHSVALRERPLVDQVAELVERGRADAVIVSGTATGRAPEVVELRAVRGAARDIPVLVGSGVTVQNVEEFVPYADGLIVGTSIKCGRLVDEPVDPKAMAELVQAVRQASRNGQG